MSQTLPLEDQEYEVFAEEQMTALIELLIKKGIITKEELTQIASELAVDDEGSDEEEI